VRVTRQKICRESVSSPVIQRIGAQKSHAVATDYMVPQLLQAMRRCRMILPDQRHHFAKNAYRLEPLQHRLKMILRHHQNHRFPFAEPGARKQAHRFRYVLFIRIRVDDVAAGVWINQNCDAGGPYRSSWLLV
jgi:hypothetical protein